MTDADGPEGPLCLAEHLLQRLLAEHEEGAVPVLALEYDFDGNPGLAVRLRLEPVALTEDEASVVERLVAHAHDAR